MQAFLFSIVVLVWGLTWYAIHLQLGATPDVVSIFWRFALAVVILWGGLVVTKRLKPVCWRQHGWFIILGITLFSCNFMLFYEAEKTVPSGLVSVIFSMATIFNALNQWAFKGIKPSWRVLSGAVMGVAGVVCLFADQLSLTTHRAELTGILLSLAGTYSFSLGNLASARATATGVDLPNAVVRGISWGVILLAGVIMLQGHSFLPVATKQYLAGLVYLSVFGTIIGFLAYLWLVAKMGPAKAAYTTVLSPIVAVAVSVVLEHLSWTLANFAGVVLILCGNIVIFIPPAVFKRLCFWQNRKILS